MTKQKEQAGRWFYIFGGTSPTTVTFPAVTGGKAQIDFTSGTYAPTIGKRGRHIHVINVGTAFLSLPQASNQASIRQLKS